MTSRDFCFWLQGSLEVSDLKTLDKDQLEVVKKHLSLVFIQIHPSMGDQKEQDKLNFIHHGNGNENMRC